METDAGAVPRLSLKGISKSFPGVKALDNVSFDVAPGTVHAICGENGAGKSTLMKIIDGMYSPDSGVVELNGVPADIKNPIDAQEKGIAMIAQELNYVPDYSIAENFYVGRWPKDKLGKIDWGKMRRETREVLKEEGLSYSTRRKLGSLTVSEIQMLEILRAVQQNAQVVIMDEPTSAIAHKEVESLFEKINELRSQGVSILYISHKLDEIWEIADDITVMRDGKVISTQPISEISRDQVIAQMVGRDLDSASYPKEQVEIGDVVLRVKGLGRKLMFEDINFDVRAGEIVGIAGLVGAGRSEVVRAIVGVDKLDEGQIEVAGEEVALRSPSAAYRNGVALLTEDRRLSGIIPKLSIRKNATLSSLGKVVYGGYSHAKAERELASEYFNKLNVKAPSQRTLIESLSGGNQQKVLLARCLIADPNVLLLDEPTRGIDVGAKFEIYKIMTDLAREGKAIVVISSELPELIGMCDRIYVMSGGRITAELTPDEYSQETILDYAMKESA